MKKVITIGLAVLLLLTLSFAIARSNASAAKADPLSCPVVSQVSSNFVHALAVISCSPWGANGIVAYGSSLASDCSTVANITITIWGYSNGSYQVASRATTNTCATVYTDLIAKCGVIYHVQAELNRWWWAGPPWYSSANTDAFSFC